MEKAKVIEAVNDSEGYEFCEIHELNPTNSYFDPELNTITLPYTETSLEEENYLQNMYNLHSISYVIYTLLGNIKMYYIGNSCTSFDIHKAKIFTKIGATNKVRKLKKNSKCHWNVVRIRGYSNGTFK